MMLLEQKVRRYVWLSMLLFLCLARGETLMCTFKEADYQSVDPAQEHRLRPVCIGDTDRIDSYEWICKYQTHEICPDLIDEDFNEEELVVPANYLQPGEEYFFEVHVFLKESRHPT